MIRHKLKVETKSHLRVSPPALGMGSMGLIVFSCLLQRATVTVQVETRQKCDLGKTEEIFYSSTGTMARARSLVNS
jgi:hypothetical protein